MCGWVRPTHLRHSTGTGDTKCILPTCHTPAASDTRGKCTYLLAVHKAAERDAAGQAVTYAVA